MAMTHRKISQLATSPSTNPRTPSRKRAQPSSPRPMKSRTVAANPDAIPVIANDPTSAAPSPISVRRSNSNRLGNAGVCGTCAHCSDSASRRFDIHPTPE
jgi:hypothetical protein